MHRIPLNFTLLTINVTCVNHENKNKMQNILTVGLQYIKHRVHIIIVVVIIIITKSNNKNSNKSH
jgi:hypothetical protein